MIASFNMHRIVKVECKLSTSEDGQYKWTCLLATDNDGQKFEVTFFGEDNQVLPIEMVKEFS